MFVWRLRDLLPYHPTECLSVLRLEQEGKGPTAWLASESIKRWENGDWRPDSGDTEEVASVKSGADEEDVIAPAARGEESRTVPAEAS